SFHCLLCDAFISRVPGTRFQKILDFLRFAFGQRAVSTGGSSNHPQGIEGNRRYLSNTALAVDSLRVLRIADPCATGPSKVRIEGRPGEFRQVLQAGAEARLRLPRLRPIALELLRGKLRQLA